MKRIIYETDKGGTFIFWPSVEIVSFVFPLVQTVWCGSFRELEKILIKAQEEKELNS